MNPKDFDWAEAQSVTVTNPTEDTFTWQVHGKEYQLESGMSASMPGYLAWVYVYGQAAKAAQAAGKWDQWNDLPVRQSFYQPFVAGVQPIIQQVEIERSLVEPVSTGTTDEDKKPETVAKTATNVGKPSPAK